MTKSCAYIIFVIVGSLPCFILWLTEHLNRRKQIHKPNCFDICEHYSFLSWGYKHTSWTKNEVVWSNNYKFYITYYSKNQTWKLSEFIRTTPEYNWKEITHYKGKSYNKLINVLNQQQKLNKQHL